MNVLIIGLIVAIVLLLWWPTQNFCRHRLYIAKANRALNTLNCIHYPGQKFVYLRKMNPFVFEELLLCAYEQQKFRVIRNKRYTGDGGIDGKVVINGQMHLIQAKRYQGYIQAAHVSDFAKICRQRNLPGLFIHTGKTGKSIHRQYNEVRIISGQALLRLLDNSTNRNIVDQEAA